MQEANRKNERPDDQTGRQHGAQGIDKAPGEEPAGDLANTKQETQQGKQQVDADITKESDRPAEP